MITIRRGLERHFIHRHQLRFWSTFNAEDRRDPLANGFGSLVTFDEVRLAPGASTARLPPPPAAETETITYLYGGALAHEDSLGNSGVVHAGEFQHMSTGHGIRHRETNASPTDWAHLFRISLRPAEVGIDCAYEQRRFTVAERRNRLCVVASQDGRKGSLRVHQDTLIQSGIFDAGCLSVHELAPGRCAWLHILSGEATLNASNLTQGDGAGIAQEPSVLLRVEEAAEILLIDTACGPDAMGAAPGPEALGGAET